MITFSLFLLWGSFSSQLLTAATMATLRISREVNNEKFPSPSFTAQWHLPVSKAANRICQQGGCH